MNALVCLCYITLVRCFGVLYYGLYVGPVGIGLYINLIYSVSIGLITAISRGGTRDLI